MQIDPTGQTTERISHRACLFCKSPLGLSGYAGWVGLSWLPDFLACDGCTGTHLGKRTLATKRALNEAP